MIQRASRMVMNRWLAILIASFAFTLVHGALWLAPPIFLLSLCLGYAYDRTRNLWVSILIHASFNAASVAMFLFLR
jgi:membrane protease YdiL (CAAX protease family)